ncbi:hypothetical protein B6N13_13125 [Marinomonas sp. UCMA 3892]|uniref:ParB N-terminal domain-containing protein n=1 Tax=unclassified Marinomonas TaxID=196814 RepID=UPI000C1DF58B|nr:MULTISPECIES: ParB N-terminal domain-containing protein [unclassified Marinomonas]NLU99019.1 hypothetical protein [Marinomonas sp. UCMA 3892]
MLHAKQFSDIFHDTLTMLDKSFLSDISERTSTMLGAKPVTFVDLNLILPNEEVYDYRVDWLANKIEMEKLWRVPVTIDRDSFAIMDGHHRRAAAQRLNLKRIPCILLDYSEVELISTHSSMLVTPKVIKDFAKNRKFFPPKSTKHIFKSPLPTCNISLELLK